MYNGRGKEVLRQTNQLGFRYLDVGEELEIVDLPEMPVVKKNLMGGTGPCPVDRLLS